MSKVFSVSLLATCRGYLHSLDECALLAETILSSLAGVKGRGLVLCHIAGVAGEGLNGQG
jgi:hypothetical protein